MPLFLGVDAGGTRTRAAVLDHAGRLHGRAEGPAGNPHSHPSDQAFQALTDTVLAALGAVGAGEVAGAVIGMAGVSTGEAAAFGARLAERAGLGAVPVVVGDTLIAFAAGTSEPDGTVLVAGTGAAAARIVGRETASTADGHGWLLGDAGSAFWLGRAAVVAALAALEGRGRPTALLPAVTAALHGHPDDGPSARARIVRAVHGRPPIALARLAPLVSDAATAGDAVAAGIVAEAVAALVASVAVVRAAEERTPIVLAGAVASGATPIGTALRDQLEQRWPGCAVAATDTAIAAARLALP